MGFALLKERRISERRKLTGLLPGRLIIENTSQELECRPVDISVNGLGIVARKELDPGTTLLLVIQDRSIPLMIAWGQPDFGKQDMMRYGLVTLEPTDDLLATFISTGCLR